jgi:squamous cell carcinoma antigen recognized by T-cells 3
VRDLSHSLLYLYTTKGHLAVPLLKAHAEFLIERHAQFGSSENNAEENEDGAFSAAWTRSSLEELVTKASKHITEVSIYGLSDLIDLYLVG